MKKSFVHFFSLVLTIMTVTACGITMPTYQGNGFSIKYPQGWTVGTSDPTKLVTISYINTASTSIDGVITVHGQPLGSNDALAVIATNEATLRANPLNQNFQSEKATISAQSTFLWKYDQTKDDKKTLYRQAMFVLDGTLYTLTGVATEAVKNIDDVEEAIKSFTIAK